MGIPWVWDATLGPMIASPLMDSCATDGGVDIGDGAWVFRKVVPGRATGEGGEGGDEREKRGGGSGGGSGGGGVPTTTPGRSRDLTELRKECARDTKRRADEMILEWKTSRANWDARGSSSPRSDSSETEEEWLDEEEVVIGEEEWEAWGAREEWGARFKHKSHRHNRPHKSRRLSQASLSDATIVTWDPEASDETLLAACRMERTIRASNGRPDLKVFTPDGSAHRSKLEALRYMRKWAKA